jgi:hypothetical protein
MNYPLLSVFWSMFWFFLWILWLILLFRVIGDIFRDDSLGGGGKTAWLLFVIIVPFLGVFVYVITRGQEMGKREAEHARRSQQEFREYVKEAAGSEGSAESLAKLAELKNHGDISEEEFQKAKTKILT